MHHLCSLAGISTLGGTKTVCQLADERGAVLAEARRGGANLQAVGELEVEKVLHDVMEEAIGERDDQPAASASVSPASIGLTTPRVVRGIMRRIGYKARVARRQRRAGRARSRRPGRARGGRHCRHRIDRLRPQRRERGGARRRLGVYARRRGQRLLDRSRGAARGPARGRPARPGDRAHGAAAALLRRRGRAGPDPRGLPRHAAAGGDRRARAVRAGRVHATATRWRSASCAAPPTSSSPRRCRWRDAGSDRRRSSCSSCRAASSAPCRGWRRSCAPPAAGRAAAAVRCCSSVEPAAGAVRLALQKRAAGTDPGLQGD